MRFDDLNWMDVARYLEHDDRLMLVLGACEQHAYLSLTTDVKIPLALADAASQQTGVLVAPPLNFGASPYFLAYPGTISLRVSTLLDIVEDMVHSVYAHGFRRILIINGHGGNTPARGRKSSPSTLTCASCGTTGGVPIPWGAWPSNTAFSPPTPTGWKPSHSPASRKFPPNTKPRRMFPASWARRKPARSMATAHSAGLISHPTKL